MTVVDTDTESGEPGPACYDPFDPAFQADPYPAYRNLRDDDPVHRHREPEFWALSRFDHVWAAVRDPQTFSSAQGLTFHPDEIGALGLAPTIVMLDPPRHTRLRALIARGFTPRRVAQMEERIREYVRARLAQMTTRAADGEAVDLHTEYSSPLPTFVLATLFDLPRADLHLFDPWVRALTALHDGGFDLSALDARTAVTEMFAYFADLITARRARPGTDLISALTVAEIDGERLTDWDILGFCFVLVAGGNDTTGNLISHTVTLLGAHPDQRAEIVADPALIPGAAEEALRMEGSVQGLARTTTCAVTVGGVEIPAGQKVMMLYGAANRDPREFGPTAERYDHRRRIRRHLGFGSGPHFCPGSHLARLQVRVALEELYARCPRVGVDLAGATRPASAFTRGWTRLPVTGLC